MIDEVVLIDSHIKNIEKIFLKMEERINKFEQQLIAELTKLGEEIRASFASCSVTHKKL